MIESPPPLTGERKGQKQGIRYDPFGRSRLNEG